MPLLTYTTSIDVWKTLGEIQGDLAAPDPSEVGVNGT